MRIALLLLVLCCSQGMAAEDIAFTAVPQTDNSQQEESLPSNGYVFDITVQNAEQLNAVLNRADKLREQFDEQQFGRIAIVLHGLELNLFRKKNYAKYNEIVEKARKLDQQNLVDIKACQTVMHNLQIQQSELPDFIEQVPLAPEEIERLLVEQGFTRL